MTAPSSPLSPPVSPTLPVSELPSAGKNGECTICFDQEVDTVIYTCGHMCLCNDCGLKLKKQINACCPICRRPIKDVIKTYRPWRPPDVPTGAVGPPSQAWFGPSWSFSHTRTYRAYISISYGSIVWVQRLGASLWRSPTLIQRLAYTSSYILAKKEQMNHVLLFYISHVISLMSHVLAEQKSLLWILCLYPRCPRFMCASAEYADRSLRLLVP